MQITVTFYSFTVWIDLDLKKLGIDIKAFLDARGERKWSRSMNAIY
jgi:hypothetical protein